MPVWFSTCALAGWGPLVRMRGSLTLASLLALLSSQGAWGWAFSLQPPHHRRPEPPTSARHHAPPRLFASTISRDVVGTSPDSTMEGRRVMEKDSATATVTATSAPPPPPPPPGPQGPTPGDLDRQTFEVDFWSETHWKTWVNNGDPLPKLREIVREVTEAPTSLPARYWLYHLGRT